MWSEDEVCPSTMMPVQDSYTDCSAGEHGGTWCVLQPIIPPLTNVNKYAVYMTQTRACLALIPPYG